MWIVGINAVSISLSNVVFPSWWSVCLLLLSGLIVCQLSVVKPVGQSVGRLYLTRFQSGTAPLIVCLPGYETAEVSAW